MLRSLSEEEHLSVWSCKLLSYQAPASGSERNPLNTRTHEHWHKLITNTHQDPALAKNIRNVCQFLSDALTKDYQRSCIQSNHSSFSEKNWERSLWMERMLVICSCITNDKKWRFGLVQSTVEFILLYFFVFSRIHLTVFIQVLMFTKQVNLRQRGSLQEGIRYKVVCAKCRSASGLLQGPGLIYCLPNWWVWERASYWPRPLWPGVRDYSL